METLKKNITQIIINGKNVTEDVTPYLSRICYVDKNEAESDDVTMVFEDIDGHWQNGWYPQQGDSLTITMGTHDQSLDCGLFEIDEIELELSPDMVTIKAVAAAINKALRSKNSKAFEKQSLKQIAQYFAKKHGLQLTGNISSLQSIEIERKTQDQQTDIAFLSGLAKEYGIVFSVRGEQLIFMDIDSLELQPAITTIRKNELSSARFSDKTSQVYGGAIVSTRNMKTNSVRRWTITPSKQAGEKGILTNDVWHGCVTAENEGQAQALARGGLKDKNKEKVVCSITIVGDVRVVAGVNIELQDVGAFSGKWHVVSSTHNIDNSYGYVTDASMRKIIA